MRPSCIFIACLVLVAFCSMAQSEWSQGPDMCCFTFTNAKIPVKRVVRYHTTNIMCPGNGIIFITKAGNKICADPSKEWVQNLKNCLDAQI